LSADFSNIGRDIKEVEDNTNCKYLHIDVMDGMFVPNISIGQVFIKSIRKASNMIFDVHLMIERPERYVEDNGLDVVSFQDKGQDKIMIEPVKKASYKGKLYKDTGEIFYFMTCGIMDFSIKEIQSLLCVLGYLSYKS